MNEKMKGEEGATRNKICDEVKKYAKKHDIFDDTIEVSEFLGNSGQQSNNFKVSYNYLKNNEYKKKNLFVKLNNGGNIGNFIGDSLVVKKGLKNDNKNGIYPIHVDDNKDIVLYNDFSVNFNDENSYSGDLRKFIWDIEGGCPFTDEQKMKIVRGIVDELRIAHVNGIGHCDVTSDNIMIGVKDNSDFTCKIVD
ncbi:MAG: hypothetical protein LBC92_05350 [Rickettsiales bacterium]|jgi:serine/threonine protein kinase|nr:hypothetical protein [Rickettsiales bacterium]